MRKYIVYYYTEKNDECVDCEMEVESPTLKCALLHFEITVKVYRRVYKIEEKTN
jgi:hypothetical protein